jgi:uncharacterized protein YjbJ (UPF0337 family)
MAWSYKKRELVLGTVKPKANQIRGAKKEHFSCFIGNNIIIHAGLADDIVGKIRVCMMSVCV